MPSKYNMGNGNSSPETYDLPLEPTGSIKGATYHTQNSMKPTDPGEGSSQEGDAEDPEKPKEQPMVGALEVFRFSTGLDRFLIVIGVICSALHGAAMPLMIIVFGDMTDTFIDDGRLDLWWNDGGGQELIFNLTDGNVSTIEEFEESLEYLTAMACSNPLDPLGLCALLTDFIAGEFLDQMNTFTIYYIILGVLVLVLGYGQLASLVSTAYKQGQRVRKELLQAIFKQEIGWFDTHEVGELNTRLADDVVKFQEGIGDKFGMFFQWLAMFFAGFIIGFIYGWKLTLVILAVSPALAISGAVMAKLAASFTAKELKAYAKAGAVAEEVLVAIRTVVAFGGQKKECERYNKNLFEAKDFGVRKGMISGVAMGMIFFILFCAYALGFWYGAKLVRDGEYTGGDVLIVFFSVLFGAFSLGNAAPNLQSFATARGAAYVIFGIIDQVPSIDSSSNTGKKLPNITGNLEFENVHFNYPSREEVKILQGLNLRVNVGQTVALVGASGCGKSTTVQLLQRFYDPNQGRILLDGVDIKEFNVKWLRQQIGVVSQEPVLFGTTIRENISYGREGVTDDEIQTACKNANAHEFIMRLPSKYETLVGERGAQLSGGQKQRIAIARALVRNPKVLLLDEATSALDTESEATVQSALDKARMGRTTIVIAHRLSTIKTADVIAGFQDGVVVEQGTHDELMQKGGIYHTLVTNQTRMNEDGTDTMAEYLDDYKKSALARAVSVAGVGGRKVSRMMSHGSDTDDIAGRTMSITSVEEEEEKLPDPELTRVMRYNSPEWMFIVLGCFAALVNGGIQPSFALLFAEIMGVFAETDMDKQEEDALFYSMMFIVLGVVAGLAMFLQGFMFGMSGENLTMRLRQMVFKNLLRQEVTYFDDHKNNVGALTTRLSTDAAAVQGATGVRLGTIMQAVGSILIGVVIGFIYSWQLSLVILAFAPFIMFFSYLEMKFMMIGNSAADKEALEKAGKIAVEAIENIRTVATLTKEEMFHRRYVRQTEIPYKKNMKGVHPRGVAYGFSQAIVFFAYAACFRFGAYLVEEGDLYYEDMFKVISAILFSAMSVGQASSFAPDYGKAKQAAARIFLLEDSINTIDSNSEIGHKPSDITAEVHFRDVHFNYPTRPDIKVLRGLDISVSPGQTLAFVGSSGCGKSTSIQLLERFYDPHEGSVCIGDNDLTSVNLQWARRQMGLVQQEPMLFGYSVRENIAYGDNFREVLMPEIIEAAKKANIHEFISSLPQGYETNVGDKGAQLSGGQKQRVAIARALIRNPKILLLDEATSALDTESEKVVQEALDKAREGRTSIVIAHRLSTIHNADIIAVIHNGKVEEQGTHDELMAIKGHYYRLNMAQAKQH